MIILLDLHVSNFTDSNRLLIFIVSTQWESGTEVSLLLVDHLKDNKLPITEDLMSTFQSLMYVTTPFP